MASGLESHDNQPSHIHRLSNQLAGSSTRLTRRLTNFGHTTALAVGVANDTNFKRLQSIQRWRAENIAGVTKEDQIAENLIENLAKTADIKSHAQYSRRQINQANMALQQDLNKFSRKGTSVGIPIQEESYLNLETLREEGADVDPETLKMIRSHKDRKRTDSVLSSRRQGPTSATPSPGIQLEQVKVSLASGKPEEFQRRMSMIVPQGPTPSTSPARRSARSSETDSKKKASIGTLYQNVYDYRMTSKAGLYVHRFRSRMKPKEEELWDDVGLSFVSPNVLESRISKEMTKAVRKLSDTRSLPDDLHDINGKGFFNPNFHSITYEDADDSTIHRKDLPPHAKASDYLYGMEAYKHYLSYITYEKTILQDVVDNDMKEMKKKLVEKKEDISKALEAAKEHYSQRHTKQNFRDRLNTITTAIHGVNKSLSHVSAAGGEDDQKAVIRTQLESIQTYTPWFMYVITVLQIIATIVSVVVADIARIGVQPTKIVSEQDTWGGYREVEHYEEANLWIGPSVHNMTRLGAMFALCVRPDQLVGSKLALYRSIASSNSLGCCEITGIGAGTTTRSDCNKIVQEYKIPDYIWRNSSTCGQRSLSATGGQEFHRFRPCCYGHKGDCELMSHSHCSLVHGRWHATDIEHCSQAHCDGDTCLFGRFSEKSHDEHEEEFATMLGANITLHSHMQLWRLPLSLLLHNGLIHVTLVAIVQLVMGTQVEKLAGWLRVGIIYLSTGMGGLLLGSTMKPLEPTVGGGGAVSGFVAVYLIELFQSWSLVPKPYLALLKLLGVILLFGTAGFLPQINQFVQIGGFIIGLLMAMICLPYITFNYWHSKARLILICISGGLLLCLTLVTWVLFYSIQPFNIGILANIDCLPLMEHICDAH